MLRHVGGSVRLSNVNGRPHHNRGWQLKNARISKQTMVLRLAKNNPNPSILRPNSTT